MTTRRWPLALAAAAALLALQGCERTPPVTQVVPPTASLPDDTVLKPGAATAAAPPTAPAPMAAASAPSGDATASAPPAATPTPPTQAMGASGAASGGGPAGDPQGARLLAQRALEVPVAGIAPTALADNYSQRRGRRTHEAIDIVAPAGTPVLAVDDGRIAKLFTSKPGGLTVYQFDTASQLAYYYAHLQRYAADVREGMQVRRGQVIGYVGSTGNADPGIPHLHFAVFRLGSPAKWWQGEAVNPYPALRRAAPGQALASR